jgi:hypothetical protein
MATKILLVGLLELIITSTNVSAADKLAEIVGGSTEWRIGRYQGAADDYTLKDEAGRLLLIAGPNATVVTSLNPVTADSEVTFRVRVGAAGGKATSVYFTAGLKNADDSTYGPLFLNLHVPAGAELESVICQMPHLPGESQGVYVPYMVRLLPKNRLTWPEMVRVRVEQDVASVLPLDKRWLTVRYVIRKNAAQVYVDGRLLREAKGIGIEPEGHVKLTVFEGSQLATLRVRPLPPEDPLQPARSGAAQRRARFRHDARTAARRS